MRKGDEGRYYRYIWVKTGSKVGIDQNKSSLYHPLPTYGRCVFRIRALAVSETDLLDRSVTVMCMERNLLSKYERGRYSFATS